MSQQGFTTGSTGMIHPDRATGGRLVDLSSLAIPQKYTIRKSSVNHRPGPLQDRRWNETETETTNRRKALNRFKASPLLVDGDRPWLWRYSTASEQEKPVGFLSQAQAVQLKTTVRPKRALGRKVSVKWAADGRRRKGARPIGEK